MKEKVAEVLKLANSLPMLVIESVQNHWTRDLHVGESGDLMVSERLGEPWREGERAETRVVRFEEYAVRIVREFAFPQTILGSTPDDVLSLHFWPIFRSRIASIAEDCKEALLRLGKIRSIIERARAEVQKEFEKRGEPIQGPSIPGCSFRIVFEAKQEEAMDIATIVAYGSSSEEIRASEWTRSLPVRGGGYRFNRTYAWRACHTLREYGIGCYVVEDMMD